MDATAADVTREPDNDEFVLRHVPGGVLWQAPPNERISSHNFKVRTDRGETGISVSREVLTSPDALMSRIGQPDKGSRIARARVADIRAIGLAVVAVPIDADLGHAEIRFDVADLESKAVRKALANLFQYVEAGSNNQKC